MLALVLAVLRFVVLDRNLTGRPEERVGEATTQDTVSFISVSIRLRYDALAELLNEQVPDSLAIPETSLVGGRSPGTTVQGAGQVDRLAPIAVEGAGSGVLASTRLKASYTLGNALLGTETLETEANVALSTAFDIDEHWKPVIAIQPRIEWIQPPESRLTRMFGLSLTRLADQQVQAMAGRLELGLPVMIEHRFNLPELIGQTWDAAHARVQLSPSPEAWLSIRPLGAHFLTPQAEADALVLNTGFSADFSVRQASLPPPVPAPLPALGKQPPPVDGISIAVPVTVDYRTLSQAVAAAVGTQTFSIDAPGGTAEIRIDDVVIYPSAPQVVLGLHVDASLPRQWLDTRGWVYLSATPVFDAQTGVLELADLRFARAVDNGWVRVFSTALHDRLVRELARQARFELATPIEQAIRAANDAIPAQLQQALGAKLLDGPVRLAERILVQGGLEGIESATFALAAEGITLYPVVTGSLTVELVPLYPQSVAP